MSEKEREVVMFILKTSGVKPKDKQNANSLILCDCDESQLDRIIKEMNELDGSPSSSVVFVERILTMQFRSNAEGAD